MNGGCHRDKDVCKIGSKSRHSSTITTNVMNHLHAYLIPQLLDSIPRFIHNTKAVQYLTEKNRF